MDPVPGAGASNAGFSIARISFPAGVTESAGSSRHTISLHTGAPVRASCVRGGRSHVALLTRGDIEIIPRGEGGRWVDEGPAECLIMRLDHGFLKKVAQSLGLDAANLVLLPRVQVRDPQLEHLGWALEAALAESPIPEPMFIHGLGVALATRLISQHAALRTAKAPRTLTRRQMKSVCDFIEANLAKRLTLATLAPVAGMSASHFKTLFRAALGIPVHRYVIRRRVARAVELVRGDRLPLSQIALATGFAHQSHMARTMRSVVGRTPRELKHEAH